MSKKTISSKVSSPVAANESVVATKSAAHSVTPESPKTGIKAATYALSAKIVVLAKANPKRPTSAAYQLFEAYKNAGTVAAYVQAVSKLAKREKAARQALNWDVKHGFVKIS